MKNISLIIPAGGVGSRFKEGVKKQFFLINEKPLLYYTLKRLCTNFEFNRIIIGASPSEYRKIESILNELGVRKFILTPNGERRVDTVFNALEKTKTDFVIIHDAVRPFVSDDIINNVISEGIKEGASICGIYPKDTVKAVEKNLITKTLNRDNILLAHTPQFFNTEKLYNALKMHIKDNSVINTDEASIYEITGNKIKVVNSSFDNIKITTQEDLPLIDILIKKYFN